MFYCGENEAFFILYSEPFCVFSHSFSIEQEKKGKLFKKHFPVDNSFTESLYQGEATSDKCENAAIRSFCTPTNQRTHWSSVLEWGHPVRIYYNTTTVQAKIQRKVVTIVFLFQTGSDK